MKPPKTLRSRREINLGADMLDLLRQHKRDQNARRLSLGPVWHDTDAVFAAAGGGYIHPDNVDRDFHRLIAKAGVKRIRIHDLRHSFATTAIGLGLPLKAVSESMGHADVATTLRIYTHVQPAQHQEIATRMSDTFLGTSLEAI